jgi:hypothetical protein
MEEAIRELRKKVGEGMMNSLRLRTLPVGVKLLGDPNELDPTCEILDEPLTFCQFVTCASSHLPKLRLSTESGKPSLRRSISLTCASSRRK